MDNKFDELQIEISINPKYERTTFSGDIYPEERNKIEQILTSCGLSEKTILKSVTLCNEFAGIINYFETKLANRHRNFFLNNETVLKVNNNVNACMLMLKCVIKIETRSKVYIILEEINQLTLEEIKSKLIQFLKLGHLDGDFPLELLYEVKLKSKLFFHKYTPIDNEYMLLELISVIDDE